MKLVDLIGLAIPIAFFTLWGIETLVNRAGHGQRFEPVKGWAIVGVAFFLITTVISVSLPLVFDPAWVERHRLMDLSGLGLWGVPIAYFAFSFVLYWFHRAEHRFDLAWRGLHQMHHAIERVDMAGWTVGHPLESIVFTTLLTATSTLVLGVDPLAAAIAGTAGTIVVMFAHFNVPTPRWVGYLILRPEQHCLHHERDVQARNYGDIALWDLLFGTFENPATFHGQVGFGMPSIPKLPAMLAFADINGARATDR